MSDASTDRVAREIEHGRKLVTGDPEGIWGWGTPAGKLRARRRAEMIAKGARLRPGIKALEIGCGTGNFTELFAMSGAHIIALDLSPELLALARRRKLLEGRVEFINARFEDGGVEGPFDAVIGSSVLHHLQVEESVLRMYRLLRPGGVLSFAEPNMLNPQVFLERKFRHLSIFSYTSPDETAFVRWSFSKLLSRVGFVEVSVTPHDWLHPATPQLLLATVRSMGLVLEKTPLLREFSGSLYIRARRPW